VVANTKVVCLAVDQKFLQDIKPRDEHPAFYAALYEFIARVTAGRLEITSRKLAVAEKEIRELKEALAAASGASKPRSTPAATRKAKPRVPAKRKALRARKR